MNTRLVHNFRNNNPDGATTGHVSNPRLGPVTWYILRPVPVHGLSVPAGENSSRRREEQEEGAAEESDEERKKPRCLLFVPLQ